MINTRFLKVEITLLNLILLRIFIIVLIPNRIISVLIDWKVFYLYIEVVPIGYNLIEAISQVFF